ncbi:MAG: hypothetical protein LBD85_01310 [Oscillospiraceae bacterium]|jgi:hypothetical protein|nr:hypothetical protein [Oscillospiraceae bacterium]
MGIVTHANLLIGEDQNALTKRAHELAAGVVCVHGGCGRCENCRKARLLIHPDITVVERDPGDAHLSVERIRRVIPEANIMPTESERAVFIVPNADKMTTQAANTFLKLLEEPPLRVVFFLLGARKKDFLQTILSRCNVIEVSDSGKPPEIPEAAEAIFAAFMRRDAIGTANELLKFEKAKREVLEPLLNGLYALFAKQAATDVRFASAAKITAEPASQLRIGLNFGAGHIIGTLMVRLNRLIM